MKPKFGARISNIAPTTILVVQIRQKKASGEYVVDDDKTERAKHLECHVRWDDDKALAEAVRTALNGKLTGDG